MSDSFAYDFIKDFIVNQRYSKLREDHEFLILSSPVLELIFLNDVAKEFYLKANGEKTLSEIFSELHNEYDVDEGTLIRDITFLVRDLQWKGVLELKDERTF